MALTTEQVFAAADALEARGITPTLALVRSELGAGSFTTISQAMGVWRERKAATAKRKEPLPEPVQQSLTAFGEGLWAAAQTCAEARLSAEREQLEADVLQANAERDEAVQLADAMHGQLDTLKIELQATTKLLEDTRSTLAVHKERLAAAESRVHEQELRVSERLAEIQRLSAQNAELSRALVSAAAHTSESESRSTPSSSAS